MEEFPLLPFLSPVRDQSDSRKLQHGVSLNLELVKNPGDHGEHMPTHPLLVLTYIMRHGLTLADEQVPHDQSIQPVPQLAARRDPIVRCRIYPLRWYDLVYDEEDIIDCMLEFHPLDIYHPPASRTNARIMHVMTLVGHGVDEFGSPYWIVKNIYGPNWGHSGFARIERSADNSIVAIDLMLRNVEDMFRFIP
ncbi:hypothetical protein TIFTF001_026189 [Ficus carica]|uniref:Peptidase C1A papain C-terminal domain-containing protein n=1 Tax=Ficus carica TaxID=3494 RepID=A0AA88IWJ5_FICCA|nr:hypothetical protein TIFTF001_026189 [Ficus carica]